MPVTNTKVGLCNEALLLVGSKPINSFDDGTDKALTCSMLYEGKVAELFGMRTWRFTVQKKQLARLVTAPVNEWKYAYQLPTDMIGGPWVVYDSTKVGARGTKQFQIYGDKLYSDDEIIVIDYQAEPEPVRFPVLFRQLLIHALAAAFAPSVAEQPKLVEVYQEAAFGTPSENRQGGLFKLAAQADAKSKPSDQLQTDEIIAARFS